MATKDFYPSMRPTLDLNFAGSRTVDPRITFTRASTATYFDEFGVMRTAHANTPRIDFDPMTGECKGLLIEEQRTNLLTYSEQFNNAAWLKGSATVTVNAEPAPDGSLTADKLIEAAVNGQHSCEQTYANFISGTQYVFSCYVKPSERINVKMQLNTAAFGVYVQYIFTLSGSGYVTTVLAGTKSSASIFPVGGGWYRCVITAQATATVGSQAAIMLFNDANLDIYTGDGTSGIYIWGAQLEQGEFPTSYIPTTTAQTTRAADSAIMTGVNFSSWYRQDEGSFIVKASVPSIGGNIGRRFITVDTGATDEISITFRPHIDYAVSYRVLDNDVTQSDEVIGGALTENVVTKFAIAIKANNFKGCRDGVLSTGDSSGSMPTVTTLHIGKGNSSLQINGHIPLLSYYPKRLSNTNLQALTA